MSPTMPSRRSPTSSTKLPAKTRTSVKAAYCRGVAIAEIARAHNVDRKTIYRWAREGSWHRPGKDQCEGAEPPEPAQAPPAPPVAVDSFDVDAVLAETISDLRRAMAATIKNYDYRPVPNIATAIFRGLEAWERRHPQSPAELAMMAITMGMDPREFWDTLAEQWRLHHGKDS